MSNSITSHPSSSKKTSYLFLVILTIIFGFSYQAVFDSKVDTNGDNAGYYILAKSIATGNGYTNIHKPEESPANHLPPGYPAIISVVFKTFGSKITTVKITNGILFLFSLIVLFFLFQKLTGKIHLSFSVTLLVLLNAHFLRFSSMMMSEIPFLLASSLTLLVFVDLKRQSPPVNEPRFYLFLLLLSASFYIRTAGIALLAGIILVLILEKNYKYLITTLLGFTFLIAPWQIRSHLLGGNSYLHQLFQKNPYRPEMGQMELTDWFQRFFINAKRYLVHEIPNGCFPYKTVNYQQEITRLDWIIGLGILSLLIFGIFQVKQHRSLLIGYLAGSFGILFLWPEVWYGVRFVLPVIPILLLLICLSLLKLTSIFRKIENILPYFYTVLILLFCFQQLKTTHILAKMPYPMNYNNYLFLAKWAKQNTSEDAIICCRKEQLFYLFSNRKTVRYKNSLSPEEVIGDMKKNKVDYVILEQLGFLSTPRYLYPAIQKYPAKFQLINHQKSPDTYLFKFTPEMGYNGEWKDNQKNGMGSYTYENGEKYTGEWKNNFRNGKGTYFLNDGNKIEGIWKNDSLQNESVKIQKLN